MRRLALGLLGAAIAAAALVALVFALASRDDADVAAPERGPGELHGDLGARHLPPGEHVPLEVMTDPPSSGPHHPRLPRRDRVVLDPNEILHSLELGNVILFYGAPRPPRELERIQQDLSGPFDRAVVAAGQAVILARRPGSGTVTAAAWRRLLPDSQPGPAREFAEHWLGRGARG